MTEPAGTRACLPLAGRWRASFALAICLFGCRTVENCYEEQAIGDLMDLTLVAPFTPDSGYAWIPSEATTNPSCLGRDGMVTGGTYRFQSVVRRAPTGCWAYGSVALTPLEGVSFDGELRFGVGVIGSWVPLAEGYWQIIAYPGVQTSAVPYDVEATLGELPPLVVRRTMSNLRDWACVDTWVGEIRRGAPGADAGADGG